MSKGQYSPPKYTNGEGVPPPISFIEKDGSVVGDSNNLGIGARHQNARGLGWIITGLFIVGEMAGGGLVAMPTAMINAGIYGGIICTIAGAVLSGYTGIQLGENWTILQQRWPEEYRVHCRKPYPAMGYRAMGRKGKLFVSVCLDMTQFGISVVFLLLASKNISTFLDNFFSVRLNFCVLILLVALILWPITMLKSPKDFWPAVIGAMITTTIAVILICVGAIIDAPTCTNYRVYPTVKFEKFFLAFGTIMFAYGGHGAFPTIQHDMRRPYHFDRSVIMAYIMSLVTFSVIVCMYLPISVIGYTVYGDSLLDSVIPSVQTKWMQQAANVLITLHVMLTLTIVFNPLNQELEELFNLPQHFGWQRFVARSGMLLAVVFVAESIPHFGLLLDLVGGSTITMMTMILPGIFNLFLVAGTKKANGKINTSHRASFMEVLKTTPWYILLANLVVQVFAIFGGVAAIYAAVKALVSGGFDPPCYVQAFQHKQDENKTDWTGSTNCCGHWKNMTLHGNNPLTTCVDPKWDDM